MKLLLAGKVQPDHAAAAMAVPDGLAAPVPGTVRQGVQCGVFAMALGAAALLGWGAGLPALMQLFPGWVAMQPWTAVAFLFAGAALVLVRHRRWAWMPLAGVAAIAGSTLWQHFSGRSLGIDHLLFSQAVRAQENYPTPGRMAEMTAVTFLLFCLACALPDRKAWHGLRAVLSTSGLVLSLVFLASYLFGGRGLPGMLGYSMVAANTALGLIVLFAGLRLSWPLEGWIKLLLSRTPGGSALRRLLPLVVGWPLATGLAAHLFGMIDNLSPRLPTSLMLVLIIVGQIWVIVDFARQQDRSEAERSRTEEALRRQNQRLELLAGGARQLLSKQSPDRLIQQLCEQVMAHLDCQVFANFVSAPDQSALRLNAHAGLPVEALQAIGCAESGQSPQDSQCRADCQQAGSCAANAPNQRAQLLATFGIEAYACLPLLYQGRTLGTLAFGTRTRCRFSEDDLEFMRTIGDLVADALAHQQSDEALYSSQERLTLALQGANAGSYEWDLDTGRALWSEELWALNGLEPHSLPACYETWRQTVHGDDLPRAESIIAAAVAQGAEFEAEWRVKVPVGQAPRWLMSRARPIRGEDGRVERYIGIAIDITERKEWEHELERRVTERTAALTAANQDLEGFTYAASHGLKGPLGRITSFSTLLGERYRESLEGDGLLFLDLIQQNAQRLNELVADLLDHAQIGQAQWDMEPIEVGLAVQGILHERAHEIRAQGAEIRLDFPERLAVQGNAFSLSLVLRNLVDNALKYSWQTPTPLVEIGGCRQGERCRLWVRDNGIGIEAQYHDRIFEIFRRLHTYQEYPGSGVGLALVKKAVERMDGRVWVESQPEQGATFFLDLRAAPL